MLSKINIRNWLIEWFNKQKNIDLNNEQDLEADYFEKDYIDSMGIIEFIAHIEENFNINFEPENFQDKRFSRINGLADIISEVLEKNNI